MQRPAHRVSERVVDSADGWRYSLRMRIGHGFDMHALVAGRPLKLGGVTVPHDTGLAGHSDADVVLHAVANAVLGAMAAGDLGRHFPPGDARYRDADSAMLLGEIVTLARSRGYVVGNLDVTIVAQAPRLAPHVEAQTARIAEILHAPAGAVNVKVSSPEAVGALGREEAIAAWAVVLLQECPPSY